MVTPKQRRAAVIASGEAMRAFAAVTPGEALALLASMTIEIVERLPRHERRAALEAICSLVEHDHAA